MKDTIVLPKKESRTIRLSNGKEVRVIRIGSDLKEIKTPEPVTPTTIDTRPPLSTCQKTVEIPNSEYELPSHWVAAAEDYSNGKKRKRARGSKKPKYHDDWE